MQLLVAANIAGVRSTGKSGRDTAAAKAAIAHR
jgi:hypothetical protein